MVGRKIAVLFKVKRRDGCVSDFVSVFYMKPFNPFCGLLSVILHFSLLLIYKPISSSLSYTSCQFHHIRPTCVESDSALSWVDLVESTRTNPPFLLLSFSSTS